MASIRRLPAFQLIPLAAIVVAFGVLVPLYKGAGFLDHRLIVAYACLPVIFAASNAASALQTVPAWQQMLRVWLLCWAFGAAILALALLTITLAYGHGRLLLPRAGFLLSALCLGFSGSAAAVALAAELTRHLAPRTIQTVFRTVFLLVIAGLFIADRYFAASLSTTAWTRLLFVLAGASGGAAVVFGARLPGRTVS